MKSILKKIKIRYWIITGFSSLLLLLFFLPIIGKKRSYEYISYPNFQGNLSFPKTFLWGTATADQQIEHAQNSDWTAFVRDAKAKKLHQKTAEGHPAAGNILSIEDTDLDQILKTADFDQQFENDFRLAKQVETNSFRFSFSWARLFPKEGMKEADPKAVFFYQKILKAMLRNGLQPSATILHFASPNWLWTEKGGKKGPEREDFLPNFEIYVKELAKHFLPQIKHWCTLNEPMVQVFFGYMAGIFPPLLQRKKIEEVAPVLEALLKAHSLAFKILHEEAKKINQRIEIGVAAHTRDFQPLRNLMLMDRLTAKMVEQNFVWDFLDSLDSGVFKMSGTNIKIPIAGLKKSYDYVGINYYGRFYVEGNLFSPNQFKLHTYDPNSQIEKINDLKWAMYPAGLLNILKEANRRYKSPIYILENGTADKQIDDLNRQELLVTHLREIGLALQLGIKIKGYFHWSLFDNFEWVEGFAPRFGLFATEYNNNFRRIPRNSVRYLQEIIRNGISKEKWQEVREKFEIP